MEFRMDDVGKFLGLLFLSRDIAHVGHLKSRSYAEHMALGDFYGAVVDLADRYAETYQGYKGELIEVKLQAADDMEPMKALKAQAMWIQSNRQKIAPTPTLANIVDEILELFHSTCYKLKFLG